MRLQLCPRLGKSWKNAGALTSDSNSQAHLWEITRQPLEPKTDPLCPREIHLWSSVFLQWMREIYYTMYSVVTIAVPVFSWTYFLKAEPKIIYSLAWFAMLFIARIFLSLLPGAKCVFRKSDILSGARHFIRSLHVILWFFKEQIFNIKCSALSYFNICASLERTPK